MCSWLSIKCAVCFVLGFFLTSKPFYLNILSGEDTPMRLMLMHFISDFKTGITHLAVWYEFQQHTKINAFQWSATGMFARMIPSPLFSKCITFTLFVWHIFKSVTILGKVLTSWIITNIRWLVLIVNEKVAGSPVSSKRPAVENVVWYQCIKPCTQNVVHKLYI